MNKESLEVLKDDELQLQWTAKGAENATLQRVVMEIDKSTAEAYVRGRDDAAQTLRDLSRRIAHQQKATSDELQMFINEDSRRSLEYRQKLGGDPRKKVSA